MESNALLSSLNKAQKEAVTFGEGPLLIVAGAGTGKTTVITRRIAWLIFEARAKSEEILALTFTDKASSEMEERVDQLLPMGYVDVWISTFHSFGERILKDYALEIGLPNQFRVLTLAEQWMLVRENLARFNLDYYRPLGNPTRFIHALIQHFSRAKDEEVSPDQYLRYAAELALNTDSDLGGDPDDLKRLREVADTYHVYQQLLLENNALDFGDLINYTLRLLRTRPRVLNQLRRRFKYILVDEFQDTNYAQYELMKLLAAPANNITVVGDDDQAIYKFRGASISNILEFKRDWPSCKEVFLTQNYRSYQNILDTAYKFIQLNNPYRLEVKLAGGNNATLSKKLVAAREGKGKISHFAYRDAQEEAEGVIKKIIELKEAHNAAWSDFAILVRANASAPHFLRELKRCQTPFEYVASKGLYAEPIIVEVLNYLRALDNHYDSHVLYRVLTSESFQIPPEDIVRIAAYAQKKAASLYDAVLKCEDAGVSEEGKARLERFLAMFTSHTALLAQHSAAEIYVQVVHDLGIEERVAHPALARDAQYLAAFYERIRRFELDAHDHSTHAFLQILNLEIEAGEEGTLPQNFEEGPDTVKVITIHSAKGLEWEYVFIPHLIDRRFPSIERRDQIELPEALIKETLPEGDVHLQEERRLFYVALTRARDGVFFSHAQDYFGKTARRPSRFLHELGFISEEIPKIVPSKKAPRMPALETSQAKNSVRYSVPESFSFTSVSTFLKCPLEYKFRYLLRLPTAGNAWFSFGSTIHKTLEEFMRLWQGRQRIVQGALFDAPSREAAVPKFDELMAIYERSWIDDWYDNAEQKTEYRTVKGPQLLKNFFDHFISTKPSPKYLEKLFKIAMGPYKFVGKIDRVDANTDGSIIIDYKTGEKARKLGKVDYDQLIIYQIAAQEFLRERVTRMMYWYLDPNQFSEPFIADQAHIDDLKERYTNTINTIVETVKNDTFVSAHERAGQHECQYT